MAKKKVETLSTFEKRKNPLTNHITKNLSYDTNKHDIIQKTHVNENNSYNKPFTIRIEQIFRCSLKTTYLIKIKHYLQKNSKLCYHLKRKKRRAIVGFIACKYKKSLYAHYRKQLYIKVRLTRVKYC